MHPHSPQITNVTPIPNAQPDLHHVMYRLDLLSAETHKLRQEMQEGFTSIRKDQEVFRKELNDQRLEFKAELNACRHEFKQELNDMHEKSRKEFDATLDRARINVKEMLVSVIATVDDRIKLSGQASDLRLIKWCARAAISSSAAAGSLAYAVSKLMP
jgi:DNA anti-recombination protein RmuC